MKVRSDKMYILKICTYLLRVHNIAGVGDILVFIVELEVDEYAIYIIHLINANMQQSDPA